MHRPIQGARGPEPPNPATRREAAKTKSSAETRIPNPPKRTERKKGPYTAGAKK